MFNLVRNKIISKFAAVSHYTKRLVLLKRHKPL